MADILYFLVVYMQLQNLSRDVAIQCLPLIVLTIMVIRSFLRPSKIGVSDFFRDNKIILIVIVLLMIASFRNNDPQLTGLYIAFRDIVFLMFIWVFIKQSLYQILNRNKTPMEVVYRFVLWPFTCLAALNILLYLAGIKFKTNDIIQGGLGDALMISYLGIHIPRVSFPLSEGYNDYAAIIGALLTLSLTNVILIKYKVRMNFVMCGVFVLTLFMSDSRAGLLFPFVAVGIVYIIKNRKTIRRLKPLYFFPIVGPIILMFLLPFLGQYDAFSFLSRSSGDLQTGNSRFLIWGISFAEFAQFKPIHLIGYGEYGHLGSGASKLWENIFSNWEDSGNKTPHNTMLVIMFDTGYIGLFFYISLLYGFIAKMIKIWLWQKPQRYLYLSYFLFMLLQGVTESTFGFYFFDYLFIFFMIFIVEMIDYKKITSESEEVAVTPELSLAV